MKLHLRKSLRFAGIVPFAAFLAFAGCSKKENTDMQFRQMPPQAAASADQGQMAPAFQLTSMQGANKSLADYKGKVVMLNFWATWCGPCKREIPDFMELQKTYGSKGLQIVGVALDDPNDVKSFAQQAGINYDILYGDNQIQRDYGNITSIPTTFLLDRNGKIVNSFVGLRPKEMWVEQLQTLL